jgi:CRISPR/Cas system-associated protein Cas10 (large subunit of type III CRISPR-Cas system)
MQIAIAVAIGVTILAFTFWVIRLLLVPQPDDPDPDEITEVAVDYRCTVCGMRLTITHAQDEHPEAPRHCREDMEEVS